MKVEVNKKEESNEIKFPCLMIYNNTIILAVRQDDGGDYEGLCIASSSSEHDKIGEYHNLWTNHFKPFKGTITLSND